MIKRLLGIHNRYFYISYSYDRGFGSCSIKTFNGSYFTINDIKKYAETESCIVLNVIELNRKDFNKLFEN